MLRFTFEKLCWTLILESRLRLELEDDIPRVDFGAIKSHFSSKNFRAINAEDDDWDPPDGATQLRNGTTS